MRRIIIVDDDADMRATLCRFLSRAIPDCVFVEAEAGLQALAQMHAMPPALVLLDLSMPRTSGFSVLRAIQSTWPALPVVLMSNGDPDRGHDLLARHMRVAAYVAKTDAPDLLTGVVRQALGFGSAAAVNGTGLPEL